MKKDRVKTLVELVLTVVVLLLCFAVACAFFPQSGAAVPAEGVDLGPAIKDIAPKSIGESIFNLVREVGMPVGGAILFLAVVISAVQIIISKINPSQRESAMTSLLYVGIGGIILGGAMFFASAIARMGTEYFK